MKIKHLLFLGLTLLYSLSINSQTTYKPLRPKDLTVKQFIQVFTEKYNSKSKLNFVTLSGDFPENWIKKDDVKYLISLLDSEKKCCAYMNYLSSHIPSENAEVGGFALIFLKSYKSKTKVNLGLDASPKANRNEAEKIKSWYRKSGK